MMVARADVEHNPDAEPEVEVMLDIFSGRPNPRWTLSKRQVEEFKKRLLRIPRTRLSRPPGLGYRGIVVTNLAKDKTFPSQVRVHDSVVSVTEAGKTMYYKDVNEIENWLLSQARSLGYADLIERARRKGPGAT